MSKPGQIDTAFRDELVRKMKQHSLMSLAGFSKVTGDEHRDYLVDAMAEQIASHYVNQNLDEEQRKAVWSCLKLELDRASAQGLGRDTFADNNGFATSMSHDVAEDKQSHFASKVVEDAQLYDDLYKSMRQNLDDDHVMYMDASSNREEIAEYRDALADRIALEFVKQFEGQQPLTKEERGQVVAALQSKLRSFDNRQALAKNFGWEENHGMWRGYHKSTEPNPEQAKEFARSAVGSVKAAIDRQRQAEASQAVVDVQQGVNATAATQVIPETQQQKLHNRLYSAMTKRPLADKMGPQADGSRDPLAEQIAKSITDNYQDPNLTDEQIGHIERGLVLRFLDCKNRGDVERQFGSDTVSRDRFLMEVELMSTPLYQHIYDDVLSSKGQDNRAIAKDIAINVTNRLYQDEMSPDRIHAVRSELNARLSQHQGDFSEGEAVRMANQVVTNVSSHPAFKDSTIAEDVERRRQEQARQHVSERSGMERQEDNARNANVVDPESLARQELEHKFAEGARIAEQQTADRLAQGRQNAQSRSSGDEQKHYAGVPPPQPHPPPQLSLAEQQQTQEITRREKRQGGERKMVGFEEKLQDTMREYEGRGAPFWGGPDGLNETHRDGSIANIAEQIAKAYSNRGITLSEAQEDAIVGALNKELEARNQRLSILSANARSEKVVQGFLKYVDQDGGREFLKNLDAQARVAAPQVFDPVVLEKQAVRGFLESSVAKGQRAIPRDQMDGIIADFHSFSPDEVARVANNIAIISARGETPTREEVNDAVNQEYEVQDIKRADPKNKLALMNDMMSEEEQMTSDELALAQAMSLGHHYGKGVQNLDGDALDQHLASLTNMDDAQKLAYLRGMAQGMPEKSSVRTMVEAEFSQYAAHAQEVDTMLQKRDAVMQNYQANLEQVEKREKTLGAKQEQASAVLDAAAPPELLSELFAAEARGESTRRQKEAQDQKDMADERRHQARRNVELERQGQKRSEEVARKERSSQVFETNLARIGELEHMKRNNEASMAEFREKYKDLAQAIDDGKVHEYLDTLKDDDAHETAAALADSYNDLVTRTQDAQIDINKNAKDSVDLLHVMYDPEQVPVEEYNRLLDNMSKEGRNAAIDVLRQENSREQEDINDMPGYSAQDVERKSALEAEFDALPGYTQKQLDAERQRLTAAAADDNADDNARQAAQAELDELPPTPYVNPDKEELARELGTMSHVPSERDIIAKQNAEQGFNQMPGFTQAQLDAKEAAERELEAAKAAATDAQDIAAKQAAFDALPGFTRKQAADKTAAEQRLNQMPGHTILDQDIRGVNERHIAILQDDVQHRQEAITRAQERIDKMTQEAKPVAELKREREALEQQKQELGAVEVQVGQLQQSLDQMPGVSEDKSKAQRDLDERRQKVNLMQELSDVGLPNRVYHSLDISNGVRDYDAQLQDLPPEAQRRALKELMRQNEQYPNHPAYKVDKELCYNRLACAEKGIPFNEDERTQEQARYAHAVVQRYAQPYKKENQDELTAAETALQDSLLRASQRAVQAPQAPQPKPEDRTLIQGLAKERELDPDKTVIGKKFQSFGQWRTRIDLDDRARILANRAQDKWLGPIDKMKRSGKDTPADMQASVSALQQVSRDMHQFSEEFGHDIEAMRTGREALIKRVHDVNLDGIEKTVRAAVVRDYLKEKGVNYPSGDSKAAQEQCSAFEAEVEARTIARVNKWKDDFDSLNQGGHVWNTGDLDKMQGAYNKMLTADEKQLEAATKLSALQAQFDASVVLTDKLKLGPETTEEDIKAKFEKLSDKDKAKVSVAYGKVMAANGQRLSEEDRKVLPPEASAELKVFEDNLVRKNNIAMLAAAQKQAQETYMDLAKAHDHTKPASPELEAAEKALVKAKENYVKEIVAYNKDANTRMAELAEARHKKEKLHEKEVKRTAGWWSKGNYLGKLVRNIRQWNAERKDPELKQWKAEQAEVQKEMEAAAKMMRQEVDPYLRAQEEFVRKKAAVEEKVGALETEKNNMTQEGPQHFEMVVKAVQRSADERGREDEAAMSRAGSATRSLGEAQQQMHMPRGLGALRVHYPEGPVNPAPIPGYGQQQRAPQQQVPTPQQHAPSPMPQWQAPQHPQQEWRAAPPRVPQQQQQQQFSAPGSAMGSRDSSMYVPSSGERSPEPRDGNMSRQSPYGGTPTTERGGARRQQSSPSTAAAGGGDRHSGRSDSRASDRTQPTTLDVDHLVERSMRTSSASKASPTAVRLRSGDQAPGGGRVI